MIPLDHFDSIVERLDRFIGQLPRPVAYAVIFLGSMVLWSLIGLAVALILRHYLR